jgi:peptidoglycan/LPS O-acetylase OafA/YrhL
LLLALAVLAVLAAVTLRPSGLLARGLSLAPLRLLGRRSYGIYLWHWPVICWLTGPGTGLSRGHLALLRIVVTLVVADLSYRLIESPVSSHRARTFSWPVRAASVVTTIGLAASGLALMLAY